MNTRKLLQQAFIVTLIGLLFSGYSRVDAQPRSGDWRVATDFGELVFTVNSDGTKITKLIFAVSNWSCGNISGSWTTTVTFVDPEAGWPISNGQFTIERSTSTGIWTINGTFGATGNEASGTWSFDVSGTVCSANWGPIILSVEEVSGGIPERFILAQNYPNPFNPMTTIDFQLPEPSHVVIKVYDIYGREVRTLIRKQYVAGRYYLTWDARDDYGDFVSSGIYIYEIQAGKFSQAKKMMLVK